MKYKIWDKKNQCWASSNIMVDHSGVLYYTFGSNIETINDPENYEVFWEIVHRGVRAFVGDVVKYTVPNSIDVNIATSEHTGMIRLSEYGLKIEGRDIDACGITKVLGHSKDLKWA